MEILIVDDNLALCNAIKKHLVYHGFSVDMAHDGQKGLRMALEKVYDMILLDVMMPQMNGYKVLKTLRAEGRQMPVIMISAKDTASDNIEGLELGADDYVQKPFNIDILLAKMRALARRSSIRNFDSDMLQYADILLTVSARKLTKDDLSITLSQSECEMLQYMIKNSSAIVPPEKLIDVISAPNASEGKIDTGMESLMKMLKYICSTVKILKIKGVGYKLCS